MASRLNSQIRTLESSAENQKKTFEIRYKGQNKEDVEFDRLVGQTRGICVQSVLPSGTVDVYLFLLEMEIKERGEKGTTVGAASTLLASRKAEVRLNSLLSSDSWRRQQENGGLNLVSFFVQWI